MSSATNPLRPALKRARIAASEAPTLSTASSAARDRVASAIASLPLHTKQLAEFWCTKVNTSQTKVKRQTKTLSTLTATPEFIPRSARVSFELTGSRLVTGQAEFTALAAATTELVSTFQTELKAHIVAVANLELTALKKELATVVVTAVVTFATVYLLSTTGKPAIADDLCLYVTQALRTVVRLSVLTLTDPERAALFTELSGFTVPPNMGTVAAVDHTANAPLQQFLSHCKALFVDPSTAYDAAEEANALALAAHNFTTLTIGGTTTAAAAAALDDEPTITSAQMESLVNASVKKATATLRSQLQKELASKPPAKNNVRGAVDRASLKKKSTKKKAPPTTTAAPAAAVGTAPRAAAAASVSFNETPTPTTGTGRGKSKRKNASPSGAGRGHKR